MSSLVTPVNGDVFTVHVIKHLKANPLLEWSNTYDFKVLDATSGTLFTDAVEGCLAFEVGITLNTVHFSEVRLSTFLPDSKPYNPEAFMSIAQDVDGTVAPTADVLPIGYAWLIERLTSVGRVGKLFLRGGLAEDGVNSAGGFPAFTFPAANAAALAAQITASHINAFFSPGSAEMVMVVAHYNKVSHVVTTREVLNFVSKQPILAKLSHKRKSKAFHTTG
jgi:hypothetical protein